MKISLLSIVAILFLQLAANARPDIPVNLFIGTSGDNGSTITSSDMPKLSGRRIDF